MRKLLYDYEYLYGDFAGFVPIWAICVIYALIVLTILLRRHDCFHCSFRAAIVRSALFASVITPSLLTDFFVVAVPGPAIMGLIFTFPYVFVLEHKIQILRACLVLYVGPWLLCTGMILGVWLLIRRMKNTSSQSGPAGELGGSP